MRCVTKAPRLCDRARVYDNFFPLNKKRMNGPIKKKNLPWPVAAFACFGKNIEMIKQINSCIHPFNLEENDFLI